MAATSNKKHGILNALTLLLNVIMVTLLGIAGALLISWAFTSF